MNANRFTEKLQEALGRAQNAALNAHNQAVDVEHLLASLLEDNEGLASSILKLAGVDLDAVSRKLERRARQDSEGHRRRRRQRSGLRHSAAGPRARARGAGSGQAQGRVRLGRARVDRDARRAGRRVEDSARSRADARQADGGAQEGSRQSARHLVESRGDLPVAGKIWPRPDQARVGGQNRSGHRTRRGNPARDPGALAPHQEQPGADRRAGRRQDRDRRGPRAANRAAATCPKGSRIASWSRSTWAR